MRIKIFAVLSLISLFSSNFAVFGQVRKPAASASKPAAAKRCSGAWTGSITYSRQHSASDNKTVKRVSNRGSDTRDWQMRYDYRASVAVLESPAKDGTSIGRASVSHNMTSVEKIYATEFNSCDRGKTFQDMHGDSVSRSETTGEAGGVEANVSIGVNEDGTYSVGVGIPQIDGKVGGSESITFSGQCTKKDGKSSTLPPTPTKLDGHSLTSSGNDRVDPSDPNHLSGSYTLNIGGVYETITWNLKRCGGEFRLTNLRFEDMKFPDWDAWQEIVEQKGTIDGNWVRVTATVLNTSPETRYAEIALKETYKGDKWDGARGDYPIKSSNVRVDAGEEANIEFLWDTSGYAWYDDGRPRLVQRLKAEVWENSKLVDDMTKNIKVAPKPLVLVHGIWSNWRTWETWQNILTTSHSYDWKAFPVGEKPEHGVMNTGGAFMSSDPTKSIGENADALERYVDYAQRDRNAWHVDIVAHSIGGLVARYYISQKMKNDTADMRPRVAHLIMLGTPNLGSPCGDVMNVIFESLGKNVEAIREIRQDYVEGFNRVNTQRKGVKFSSLAGNPLPTLCKMIEWNDGFIPVPSAKWNIADSAESKSIHTDLTGTSDFSSFVKPRLAIGPRGDHNPAVPETRQGSLNADASFVNAAFAPSRPTLPADFKPDFAKSVKLAPKSSVEIEIPVNAARDLGLTMMAVSDVSATLIDDKGAVAGSSLAKTPAAAAWFRSIYVDHEVASGTWKLRLENTSDKEQEAVFGTWKDAIR